VWSTIGLFLGVSLMSFGEIIELIFICLQAVYIRAKSSVQKNRACFSAEKKKEVAFNSQKRADSKGMSEEKEN